MWLTNAVAEVLGSVLGSYIEGIERESLRLSVWNGDIKLHGLVVKADAVEALLAEAALPVRVVGATLGTVQVKVPWRNLGSEPMVVQLDRLFIVLAAKEGREYHEAEESERAERTKREQLEAWESLDSKKNEGGKLGSTLTERLVRTLLQKLEVHVTNVHVRIQDDSGSGSLAAGLVLSELHVGKQHAETPPNAAPAAAATSAWSRARTAVRRAERLPDSLVRWIRSCGSQTKGPCCPTMLWLLHCVTMRAGCPGVRCASLSGCAVPHST
jgi:hypothetical protein